MGVKEKTTRWRSHSKSRRVQVDVAALNRNTRRILSGECKWGSERIDRQVVRELVEDKTPLVLRDLPGEGQG